MEPGDTTFGALLRRYRLAAPLSQEALAERAGISTDTVRALERGRHGAPHLDTLAHLAGALRLEPEARACLIAAADARRVTQSTVEAPGPNAEPGVDIMGTIAAAPSVVPPPRHNLPATLTEMVGREREQAEVLALLATARLVTLVGTGGVGKTRLALAVGAAGLDHYPDGVWLVELAPLTDPALVPSAVATTLGVREAGAAAGGRTAPSPPILTPLADFLRGRRMLLVLDNCEHLLASCADLISYLLRAGPTVRILATSQVGLGVSGEQQYRVPALSIPERGALPSTEALSHFEAVRLFVARAQVRRRDFSVTAANGAAVAAICTQLDGVPLAIELAAARVGSLSVEAIAARLDARFRLLTGGARDAPSRQQTLRATVDWGWGLLEPGEQALLRRLSVFAGGWTLAAAAAVCAADEQEDWPVLDGLDGLANKSLLQLDESVEGEPRYRLLETVRAYGAERLTEAAERTATQDRHLACYLALAEEAAPELIGPQQRIWLGYLAREHDNLRAALTWARERGGEAGPRLAGALINFWWMNGHWSEGRLWAEALAANAGPVPDGVRATALHGAAVLAEAQGDFMRAATLFAGSLELFEQAGDRRGLAMGRIGLGSLARHRGENERARVLLLESLALGRDLDDRRCIAHALVNLGAVVLEDGNMAAAQALLEESLDTYRSLNDCWGITLPINLLALLALRRGDGERAWLLFLESLLRYRAVGSTAAMAMVLDGMAVAAAEQTPLLAIRLFGAVAAARDATGSHRPPHFDPDCERGLARARAAVSEPEATAAYAAGRALQLDEAIQLALVPAPGLPAYRLSPASMDGVD